MNWDDLRYILTVYDTGSVLAASQQLGVNASTVQRRIVNFEIQNNVRLFERLPSGYSPTKECEVLLRSARDIDNSVARIELEVLGQDLRLDGHLSITSTDSIATNIVAPHLCDFHRLHPEITIEVTITNSKLNLARQEADIAIRPSISPPNMLIGKQIKKLEFGIYATPDLIVKLPEMPALSELVNQKWLGVGESLAGSLSYSWMNENIPATSCKLFFDSYGSMAACASRSMGFAVLPCHLADPISELQRLECSWFNLNIPIWVLIHPQLKNAARPKAFMDYITNAMRLENSA